MLPLLLLFVFLVAVQAERPQFLTEPLIDPGRLIVKERKDKGIAPGFVWITLEGGPIKTHFGPHIFDQHGTLVWYGQSWGYHFTVNAHVCDYLGEKGKHICFNDVRPRQHIGEEIRDFNGHSDGIIRVLDHTYTPVGFEYGTAGDLSHPPDFHELNVIEDGETLLQDVYEVKQFDLTKFSGPKDPKKGYIYDGCFQEIDMRTKNVTFQWCATDHINIWDTYLYIKGKHKNETHAIAGKGEFLSPWDFFHMNAVDKNEDGDYLVSSRHLDTLFKIAGNNNTQGKQPGEIMWRLGGRHNDFERDNMVKVMSRQHCARFVSKEGNVERISVFNNAWDGTRYIFNPVHTSFNYTFGMVLEVDEKNKKATMVKEYPNKYQEWAGTQGSMQHLPNGNWFIGWGDTHYITEFTPEGDVVYNVTYAGGDRSYRSWKMPWVGIPKQNPKVLIYALNCNAPLKGYVSWNGATEVKEWAVYFSNSSPRGPWRSAGRYKKSKFETELQFSPTYGAADARWTYINALDEQGNLLGTSDYTQIFMPKEAIYDKCNENCCPHAEREFPYSREWATDADCTLTEWRDFEKTIMRIVLLLLVELELVVWAYHRLIVPALFFGAPLGDAEAPARGSRRRMRRRVSTSSHADEKVFKAP